MPADRVHLLPNAVRPNGAHPPDASSNQNAPRLFLYPTRAIRRKNLGEFLLWAALAQPGDHFASTLAPTSPADRAAYDRWVEFAAAEHLPVDFGIGMSRDVPMAELLASAHAVVSTSIARGWPRLPRTVARPSFLRPQHPDITAAPHEGLDLPTSTLNSSCRWRSSAGTPSAAASPRTPVPADKYNRTAKEADIDAAFAAAVRNGLSTSAASTGLQSTIIAGLEKAGSPLGHPAADPDRGRPRARLHPA